MLQCVRMFPLYYILIPYFFFLLVSVIFLFFNIFHLARYGIFEFGTKALMLFDVVIFTVIVIFTLLMFSLIPWASLVDIGDLLPGGTSFSRDIYNL